MKNVKILVANTEEFIEVVKQIYEYNKDIQICIEETLYKRLVKENEKNIIWEELIYNDCYNIDEVERAYMFLIEEKNKKTVYQMHFKRKNPHYIYLSFFASKGIIYKK